MTPFQSMDRRVSPSDAAVGYEIPPKHVLEEFCRKADAFLARREGAKGKYNFASQQFVQEEPEGGA